MPRTATAPPTDRRYWKRLLSRVHPDGGGAHDLFIWTQELREHVAGDAPEEAPRYIRREPPKHKTSGDRLDFQDAELHASFTALTRHAVSVATSGAVGEPHASVLKLLRDCEEITDPTSSLYRQQQEGATYRSVAAVAHRAGMSAQERSGFYRVAESIPLSQRHVGHILARLQAEAA